MIRDRVRRVTSVVACIACVALAYSVARANGADSTAAAEPYHLAPMAVADSISQTVDSTLVSRLKKGGYIVWFRHCVTNWAEQDTQERDFSSRANQRNLSEAGRAMAVRLGKAIAALKFPIERVLASPMWRARDTAQLAFGAYDTTGMLFFKGPQFREARIKMLSTPPAPGKNLVYVGHQDPLLPIVPGLKRDQVKEGDALVIQPLGEGKFRVIVQVSPADWARLAGLPAAPPAAGGGPNGSAATATAPPDSAHSR